MPKDETGFCADRTWVLICCQPDFRLPKKPLLLLGGDSPCDTPSVGSALSVAVPPAVGVLLRLRFFREGAREGSSCRCTVPCVVSRARNSSSRDHALSAT